MTTTKTKTPHAVVMNPDGTGGHGRLKDTSLETLQALVGGYIEEVRIRSDLHAWVNEEGLLYHLPPNVEATMLMRVVADRPTPDLVVGPVVFLGVDADGEETDVPDWFVPLLVALLDPEPVPDEETPKEAD